MVNLSVQEDKLLMMGGMFENIIHQFKQPLNAINTEATGLKFQKEIGLLDDATFLESLDNIVQSTKYLSDTIDDFRDFLKEDRIKEYFHVKKVIEQIESIIKPLLNAKGIVVEKSFTRETIEINGFPREFSQVIINILITLKMQYFQIIITIKSFVLMLMRQRQMFLLLFRIMGEEFLMMYFLIFSSPTFLQKAIVMVRE